MGGKVMKNAPMNAPIYVYKHLTEKTLSVHTHDKQFMAMPSSMQEFQAQFMQSTIPVQLAESKEYKEKVSQLKLDHENLQQLIKETIEQHEMQTQLS